MHYPHYLLDEETDLDQMMCCIYYSKLGTKANLGLSEVLMLRTFLKLLVVSFDLPDCLMKTGNLLKVTQLIMEF